MAITANPLVRIEAKENGFLLARSRMAASLKGLPGI